MKKQYIGPYQIKETTETTDGYIKVTYVDDKVEFKQDVFSKDVFEAVKTEEESDLTILRDTKCKVIMKKVLKIILEDNICTGEVTYLMNLLANSAHNSEKSAIEKKMGEQMDGITFRNLHTILTD